MDLNYKKKILLKDNPKMQLQIIDMLNMIKRKLKEEISTMNVLSRKKIENFTLI